MSRKNTQENLSACQKEGKEAWFVGKILFKLYGLSTRSSYRRLIRFIVLRLEGGGHYSRTIRRIFSVYHQIEIGMYTNDPCYCLGRFPAGAKIGRYCSIFPTVYAFSGNHPVDRMSTHAFFFNPVLGYAEREHDITRTRLTIGNDVFIGHNAVIVASVDNIGDGAIIGAGAVVTKNVPDFAVVVGNPAQVIKYRFSEEMQHKIKASKWWDKNMDELHKDLDKFISPLENEQNKEHQKS